MDDENEKINTDVNFSWKNKDGIDLTNHGWEYKTDLTAALNRKNLKNLLKAQGLGDKADATGLIAEYLNTISANDSTKVSGEDRKWLESRRSLYGYTLDKSGNRDYHKKQNSVVRGLATVLGGLALGPTGAFIANMLAKPKLPTGLKNGFYTSNNKSTDNTTSSNLTWNDLGTTYKKTGDIVGWTRAWAPGTTSSGVIDNTGNFYTLSYTLDSTGNPISSIVANDMTFLNNKGLWTYTDDNGVLHTLDYDPASRKFSIDGTILDLNPVMNKKGGIMRKLEYGGLPTAQPQSLEDALEKLLLAATCGIIGYAKSLGSELDLESAVVLVLSLAKSDPKLIELLVLNSDLVNAGILSLLTKDPEKFKLLQLKGAMNLYVAAIINKQKNQPKLNKKTKAMNGTKLNYIKELKGICPEGYEIEYFSTGGHLCNRCAKKKEVEEAKCGKKMKAKKHSEGGGISDTANNIKDEVLKKTTSFKDPVDGTLYENISKADSAFLAKMFPRKNRIPVKQWTPQLKKRVRDLNIKVTESPTL